MTGLAAGLNLNSFEYLQYHIQNDMYMRFVLFFFFFFGGRIGMGEDYVKDEKMVMNIPIRVNDLFPPRLTPQRERKPEQENNERDQSESFQG